MELEIYCDASIKNFPNKRMFGCAGAIAPNQKKKVLEVLPDATNNKSELRAIYLACVMAKEITDMNPNIDSVTIYSDSKISVYGLRVWLHGWLKSRDSKGIMYTSSGQPVSNQDELLKILDYIISNGLRIKLRHQKGHVNVLSEKSMNEARRVFYESNGYYLENDLLSKICFYNNAIDGDTRRALQDINPDSYGVTNMDNLVKMCYYVPPENYHEYIY